MGNIKGTITPEYPVKPWYKTEEKARRANEIANLALSGSHEGEGSNPSRSTICARS
jgi:hypothetical protein